MFVGCVQVRYRQHFENRKFFEKELWKQMYDNIQNGLNALRNGSEKNKKTNVIPRIPYISGLFVAKTINITTDPLQLLYKPLTFYMRLKNTFNFQCIPEFNVLFYSAEIEHNTFRQFIIDIIRNGIKTSSDLFLLVSTLTFKVLMGFYGCAISTLEINLLILSLFSTCVKIPASTDIMINTVGILPWLSSIIIKLEFHQFDVIEGVISILNNLWYATKANAANHPHDYDHIQSQIHRLVLRLLPHLSGRIEVSHLTKLLNILNKTANGQYEAINADQLNMLISCVNKHFPEYIQCIVNIKEKGAAGAASNDQFCKSLHATEVDSMSKLALCSLRAYVIAWSAHHGVEETKNSS